MIRFTLEEITEKSAKNRAAHNPSMTEDQLKAIALRNAARPVSPLGHEDDAPVGRPKGRKPGSTRAVKAAKKPVPTEHQEQVAVIQWWDVYGPANGYDIRLLHATPNGSNKSIAAAVRFRDEGLRAGHPDLSLDVPKLPFHGLRIELKRVNGTPSQVKPEQTSYHHLLMSQGYAVRLCYGAQEAIDAIKGYLCTK